MYTFTGFDLFSFGLTSFTLGVVLTAVFSNRVRCFWQTLAISCLEGWKASNDSHLESIEFNKTMRRAATDYKNLYEAAIADNDGGQFEAKNKLN